MCKRPIGTKPILVVESKVVGRDEDKEKEHFKLQIWIYVSEEFGMHLVVKSIIDLIIQGDCNIPGDNMELLQRRLRLELSGKRYLLVLDDVWSESVDKWEHLRALLPVVNLEVSLSLPRGVAEWPL